MMPSTPSRSTRSTAFLMAALLSLTCCATATTKPPAPAAPPQAEASSAPASAPASQPAGRRWVSMPRLGPCNPRSEKNFYCLSIDDAKALLHWQEDQRRDFEAATVTLETTAATEKVRREAVTSTAGTWETLKWISLVGATLAAGFGLGWLGAALSKSTTVRQ